jgi:hypothetical protein
MEEAPSACSSLNGSHSFPSPSLFRTPSSASSHPCSTPLQVVILRSRHQRRSERLAALNKERERRWRHFSRLCRPLLLRLSEGGATEPSLLLSLSVREGDQPASRSPPASSDSGRCSLCFVPYPANSSDAATTRVTSCVFSQRSLATLPMLSVEPARASVDDRWRAAIDNSDVDKKAPWTITRQQPR